MKQKIWIIVLGIFIFNLVFRIGSYWNNYTQILDGKYWKGRYEQSQWVVANSKNSIGDDGLYAYQGVELLKGLDPSLYNPEVPPLGKYLIGLTVLVFHNNNVFGLITGLLALFSFYLFNRALFKNSLVAFIPVCLFSLEPLFFEQLQSSYIDAIYLSTLLFTFYFFLKRNYTVSGIFLGLFASTKFSPLFLLLPIVLLAYIVMRKLYQDLQSVLLSFFIAPCILLLTYLAFFLHGKGLTDFLKLQKYIYVFYAIGAKPKFIGMVFPMLFANRWYTWWDGVVSIREWTISWFVTPLLFVYGSLRIPLLLKSPILLCVLWSCAYTIFLLFIPVYPRYLLLLLPFLYNVGVWAILTSIPKKSLPPYLSV